jgi:hypothetical protein
MTYDEFKLQGREAFSEYRYYKGEDQNPYDWNKDPIQFKWWNFEKDYHDNYKPSGRWKTFTEYFDHWIKGKAAPEIGHDLSKGNPWKVEYQENSPF